MARLILLAGLLAATGCSDASMEKVSGTVTMDGKPLPRARLLFTPSGTKSNPGSGSYAITGPDGRYELRQVDPDREGALVGPHRVEITTVFESRDDGRLPKETIPKRYNEDSELTFEVTPGGSSTADFQLQSTPR